MCVCSYSRILVVHVSLGWSSSPPLAPPGRINMLDVVQKTGDWLPKSIIYPLIRNTDTTRAYTPLGTHYTASEIIPKLCEKRLPRSVHQSFDISRLVDIRLYRRSPTARWCLFGTRKREKKTAEKKSDYRPLNSSLELKCKKKKKNTKSPSTFHNGRDLKIYNRNRSPYLEKFAKPFTCFDLYPVRDRETITFIKKEFRFHFGVIIISLFIFFWLIRSFFFFRRISLLAWFVCGFSTFGRMNQNVDEHVWFEYQSRWPDDGKKWRQSMISEIGKWNVIWTSNTNWYVSIFYPSLNTFHTYMHSYVFYPASGNESLWKSNHRCPLGWSKFAINK